MTSNDIELTFVIPRGTMKFKNDSRLPESKQNSSWFTRSRASFSLPSPRQAKKRLQITHFAILDGGEVIEESTAWRLIKGQQALKMKFETSEGSQGSCMRTLLLSTVAAGSEKFRGNRVFCRITCIAYGAINAKLSNSNIAEHYKSKHKALFQSVTGLSKNTAT